MLGAQDDGGDNSLRGSVNQSEAEGSPASDCPFSPGADRKKKRAPDFSQALCGGLLIRRLFPPSVGKAETYPAKEGGLTLGNLYIAVEAGQIGVLELTPADAELLQGGKLLKGIKAGETVNLLEGHGGQGAKAADSLKMTDFAVTHAQILQAGEL